MFENVSMDDKIRLTLGLPGYFVVVYGSLFAERFSTIYRSTSNWYDAVAVYFGMAKEKRVTFKNGQTYDLNRSNFSSYIVMTELFSMSESVNRKAKVEFKGDLVSLNVDGKRLKLTQDSAFSVAYQFYYGEYNDMDLKGRDVVDVGAYVADTPLYYVIRCNARHVYGYEPFPYLCRVGEQNVKMNGFTDKITMLNEAVTGKDSHVSIDDTSTSFGYVGDKIKTKSSKKVPTVSLNTVVKRYGLSHAMAKIDCEGGEYEIIDNASSDTLRKFDILVIEYHYGYKNLAERLRREGYKVTYTKPVLSFKWITSKPMIKGYLTAIREGAKVKA